MLTSENHNTVATFIEKKRIKDRSKKLNKKTMTVLGMIAKDTKSKDGVEYYRLMTFLEILSILLYGFVFLFLLKDSQELVVDRVLTLFIATMAFSATFLEIEEKIIKSLSLISFYAFTTQVLLCNFLNEYSSYHFISLLIAFQAISIACGGVRVSRVYLICFGVIGVLGIAFQSDMDYINKFLLSGSIAILSILLFILIYGKNTFEQKLKFKEEFLRTLVSKTEEGILITNFDGDIFETNTVAISMFGYRADEIENKNFSVLRKSHLTQEEDDKGVHQILENKFWNDEITLVKQDKSEFDAFVSISLIKKNDKEFLVYRVSDITMRKSSERELVNAKDLAEQAAIAKSSFLATISHEIRTPMNGVIGMANALDNTELDKHQKRYVNTIQRSSKNLLTIINEVLDFSKAESGKMTLELIPCSLKEVIEDVLDLMSPTASEKNVNLTSRIDANTPLDLITDPTKIKQILTNLVSNALKFTNKGGVHIDVRARAKEKRTFFLEFKVGDTGIGIPEEKLSNVFESFTQSDSSTSRKYGGTGLGLSICKKLVNLMGGNIWAKSEEGKGSTFIFSIKASEYLKETDSAPIILSDVNDEELLMGYKILIAEDNRINQEVALLILKGLGGTADIAENGKETLEACRLKDYDLIFMDVQMPEMDGLDATKLILSNESSFGSPYIIAMTAGAFEEDMKLCLDSGMKDFISKPIMLDRLKSAITKFRELVEL